MIRIRIALLGAVLALGAASTAQAQGQQQGRPGAMRPGQGAGMEAQMLRGIELTDAQRAQMQALHQRHVAERDSLRARLGGGRPDSAQMVQYRALTDRHHAELRAILTPAQQATFDQNATRMRERMERRRGLGRGGRMDGSRRPGGARRDSSAAGKRLP